MSDGTKIEWTDATANAINGCTVVSPGCANCYAMKQAHRFPVRQGLTRHTPSGMTWTGEVRFHEPALLQVLRWKRPRRIFWNAHGDLFHPAVPDEWIDRCFAVMALTPHHTHQVLTKRPERMRAYLRDDLLRDCRVHDLMEELDPIADTDLCKPYRWPLPNVWLGVSVEDQQRADERIPILLVTPAAVRWLSCEPLLGPIDLRMLHHDGFTNIDALSGHHGIAQPMRGDCASIDWVVVGGESGPGARPMHPDWARSLRDQCAAAGVPFLFKQWGEWAPDDGEGGLARLDRIIGAPAKGWAGDTWHDQPKLISEREIGENDVYRLGKRTAGRLIDGRQHDGYPA